MSKQPDLSGYVDVAERIGEFRAKHPDGSLQPADPAHPFEVVEIGQDRFVVVVAAAYRTPDDPRPGIGQAAEPYPGKTPYTRGSELQNAETSAWGRAIVAALAADTRRGVASADEVHNRAVDRAAAEAPGDPEMVAAVLAEAAAAGASEDTARDHAVDQHGVVLEDLAVDQLRAEWTHWHGVAALASTPPASPTDPAPTPAAGEPASEPQNGAQPRDPEPPAATRGQSAKLHALLNAGRVADRAAKLRVVSALAGRELTSTSQLIKDEAVTVIDTLEAILTGPDPAATLAGMAIDDTHDQVRVAFHHELGCWLNGALAARRRQHRPDETDYLNAGPHPFEPADYLEDTP